MIFVRKWIEGKRGWDSDRNEGRTWRRCNLPPSHLSHNVQRLPYVLYENAQIERFRDESHGGFDKGVQFNRPRLWFGAGPNIGH